VAASGTRKKLLISARAKRACGKAAGIASHKRRQQEDSSGANSSDGNSLAAQEVANTSLITMTLRQDNYIITAVGLHRHFVGHHIMGAGERAHLFTITIHNTALNNTTLPIVSRSKYLHTQIM
jgi:hypothetical protein